jgi:hypothetical protein
MLTTLARTLRFNSDGASVTSFEGGQRVKFNGPPARSQSIIGNIHQGRAQRLGFCVNQSTFLRFSISAVFGRSQ